jgi:DNA modification methylase
LSPRDPESARPRLEWPGRGAPRAPLEPPAALDQVELLAAPERTDGWRNRLIRGDNRVVMSSLGGELSGQFDFIYLDPPYGTGVDRAYRASSGPRTRARKAYGDRDFKDLTRALDHMEPLLNLARGLLSDRGSLYLHIDYRLSHHLRLLLDDVFGPASFVNELIWFYKTGGMSQRLGFARKHDTVLFYAKDPKHALWTPQKEKSYLRHRYGFSNVDIQEDQGGRFSMVNCRDVLEIPALRGNQAERVDYPTQKPRALLERLIRASTVDDSLIGDFTCGSGTTLVCAEALGRRFVGCDRGAWAIHTSRKRLEELPLKAPLSLESSLASERARWFDQRFDGDHAALSAALGDTEDRSDRAHVHGVDARFEAADLEALRGETRRVRAWRWSPDIDEALERDPQPWTLETISETWSSGPEGLPAAYPRPRLTLEVEADGDRRRVALRRYEPVEPGCEWADMIDHWSVDAGSVSRPYQPSWSSYRTRQAPALELVTPWLSGPFPGALLRVQVIDLEGKVSRRTARLSTPESIEEPS